MNHQVDEALRSISMASSTSPSSDNSNGSFLEHGRDLVSNGRSEVLSPMHSAHNLENTYSTVRTQ